MPQDSRTTGGRSDRRSPAHPRASSASTSAAVGIEFDVPARVTEIPATAQPRRTAAGRTRPRAMPVASRALKAAPAPVVSTTGPALTAGRLPVLAYDAGHRVLHYREDAGTGTVPSADRFRAQLDVLIAVARLSAAANR